MNSFEIQKVISAILITILVVFGIGKISNFFFNKDLGPVVAYKVDAPEGSEKDSKKDSQLDLNAMFALADLAHGEKVFKKCAACHSIKEGGGNKIGPKLWNVMFRPVGAVEDYKYSKSLMSYKKEWTWEEMNGFLIKPSSWIKGNKMGFAGLKDEKDRASVMLYLNQNSSQPKELP